MDYTGIQKVTFGQATLSLTSYSVRAWAIVQEGVARTGTRILFEGHGEVTGSDANDLATQLAAIPTNLAISGQDLKVFGLNSTLEYQLLAAQCWAGGPHGEFEIIDGHTPLQKIVTIRIRTEQPTLANTAINNYTSQLSIRADGLETATWTGTISGPNAVDYLLSTVLPQFRKSYPLPEWKVQYEYSLAQGTTSAIGGGQPVPIQLPVVTYTISAVQFFGALPATIAGFAVDGTAQQRAERDEQQRLNTTYSFDLLIVGNAIQLATSLLPEVISDNSGKTK
jgi:hypothetical protein